MLISADYLTGEGKFPLILGGDHSIGIGVLAGLLQARPDVGVLWIDAHADINTPEVVGTVFTPSYCVTDFTIRQHARHATSSAHGPERPKEHTWL